MHVKDHVQTRETKARRGSGKTRQTEIPLLFLSPVQRFHCSSRHSSVCINSVYVPQPGPPSSQVSRAYT